MRRTLRPGFGSEARNEIVLALCGSAFKNKVQRYRCRCGIPGRHLVLGY